MALDLDELRNSWQTLSLRVDNLEATNRRLAKELCSERATSVQQRLARSYRFMSVWGFVLLPLAFPLYYVIDMPAWLCVLYAVFGILMGLIYLCFASYISRSNYVSLPMVDAVRHALRVRMMQRRILVGGLVMGLVVIVPFFWILFGKEDPVPFYGACVGGAVGLAIGIQKELKFFRLSRQMLAELRRFTSGD